MFILEPLQLFKKAGAGYWPCLDNCLAPYCHSELVPLLKAAIPRNGCSWLPQHQRCDRRRSRLWFAPACLKWEGLRSCDLRYTDRLIFTPYASVCCRVMKAHCPLLLPALVVSIHGPDLAGAATSVRSFFPNPAADRLQIVLWKVIVCFVLLRAAEGVADVVQGLPWSVHGSHQLSIFLCDLSYWRVWKLLRWDEPRHGAPPNLLGGQPVSGQHLPQHQCHTRPLIYLAGKWLYCR